MCVTEQLGAFAGGETWFGIETLLGATAAFNSSCKPDFVFSIEEIV